jgi:hypothetical protein
MNKHIAQGFHAYDNGNIVINKGGCVATVHKCHAGKESKIPGVAYDLTDTERTEIAHLIAAAPEMYEAILNLVDIIDDMTVIGANSCLESGDLDDVKAAIAKAEGKQ